MPMLCLENSGTDPHFNLALEEFLCRRAARDGSEIFMLWRNVPSVIIGRFQDAQAEVNAAFVDAHCLPVVRRNSGGGAVYHDLGNVNYSFILPDRREHGFKFFAEKIIGALANMGVVAEFSQTGNDITVKGRKISGMAQHRHNGVLLCHGTLLFDCNRENMAQALSVPDEKLRRHGVKSSRGRVTNLRPFFPGVAETEAFMALLWRALQEGASSFMESIPFSLSARDEEEVRELMERKYRSRAWNELGEEQCDADAFFQH